MVAGFPVLNESCTWTLVLDVTGKCLEAGCLQNEQVNVVGH